MQTHDIMFFIIWIENHRFIYNKLTIMLLFVKCYYGVYRQTLDYKSALC